MSRTKLALTTLIAFCLISPLSGAQVITLDQVIPAAPSGVLPTGEPIDFHLRITNGPEPVLGLTNGFRVYSNDSVYWGTTTADTLNTIGQTLFDGGFFINEYSVDGVGADTVGFGGFRLFGTGLPGGFDAQAYRVSIGPIYSPLPAASICLDSSFYPPTGEWKWALQSGTIFPGWGGPYCFTIGDTLVPPDTLVGMVQWTEAEGGNGHWYGILPECHRWVEADSLARTFEMDGHAGYLATVTSQSENDFILHHVLDGWQSPCHDEMFWLGGRDFNGWSWITGEPWEFENWAPGEPNNVGIETALNIYGPAASDPGQIPGKWNNSLPNDIDLHLYWSVVEFGPVEPGDHVTPTDTWISLYCDHAFFNDTTILAPGTTIRVFDPDGVLCGVGQVDEGGSYGFLPVYGDDQFTDVDEGAEPGDRLKIKLGDRPVITSEPVYWSQNGDYLEICNFYDGRCMEFNLGPGWHLISWNVQYADQIEHFLHTFSNSVDVVMSFDQGGLMYVPGLPEFSTLHNVDYNHGYWLRLTAPVQFDICGLDLYPFVWDGIPIYPGWNLVGYWPDEMLPPEAALMSLMGLLEVAYGFDNGVEIFIPGDPLHNTLMAMDPGFGYWVKSTSSAYLYYVPADCTYVARQPLPAAKTQALPASRSFMALYGKDIEVEGQPLADGSKIEVYTSDGVLCGSGRYANGMLKFMPVYGRDLADPETRNYPSEGDRLQLMIDNEPVEIDLTWQGNGSRVELASLARNDLTPGEFGLAQNYPNPFNPTTTIRFSLAQPGEVNLAVYNILGQQVAVVADGFFDAGSHEVVWKGTDDAGHPVSSGVYLYRLQSGESTVTRKMLLMK